MEKITLDRWKSDNFLIKKNINNQEKSFGETLKSSLEKVNDLQIESNKAINDFSLEKNQDVHDVMIKWEKADLSLRLMMKIREKVLNAYEEIMRMQV